MTDWKLFLRHNVINIVGIAVIFNCRNECALTEPKYNVSQFLKY